MRVFLGALKSYSALTAAPATARGIENLPTIVVVQAQGMHATGMRLTATMPCYTGLRIKIARRDYQSALW